MATKARLHWFWRAVIAVLVGANMFAVSLLVIPTVAWPFNTPEFLPPLLAGLSTLLFAVLAYSIVTVYAGPLAPDGELYCRKCGYQLSGLSENRCPECGRAFDPATRRTFDRRPSQWRVRWWRRRILAVLIPLGMLVGGSAGWVYWRYYLDWAAEQQAFGNLPIMAYGGLDNPAGPAWLQRVLGPFGYVMDRGASIGLQNGADLSPADLACLRQFKQLQGLGLDNTNLTDADLTQLLRDHPQLQSLSIANTHVNDAGIAHLSGQTALLMLNLSSTQITDAGVKHLAGLTALCDLKLRDTAVTDAGLTHLAGLPALHSLDLSGTHVTAQGIASLKGMPLTSLALSGQQVSDVWVGQILLLPRLQQLILRDTAVTDAGLAQIGNLPLTGLVLAGAPITDAGVASLQSMTGLWGLDLSGTKVTDAGLATVGALKGLQYLYLNDTPISDVGVAKLQGLKNLCRLDLNRTQVTDAGLTCLKSLPSLQEVQHEGTQVRTGWVNSTNYIWP